MSSEHSLFYCTCPDEKTAEAISRTLLEEKLVACTNILPGTQSHYWWQGKIESSSECVLILKSRKDLKLSLENRYKSLHPYKVPCFLEISVESGSLDYLQWLSESFR
jgi:periplasmic divalent cation tolerance protein